MKTNRYKVRFISGHERVIKAKSSSSAFRKAGEFGNPTHCTKLPSRWWYLGYVAGSALFVWFMLELSK